MGAAKRWLEDRNLMDVWLKGGKEWQEKIQKLYDLEMEIQRDLDSVMRGN